MSANLRLREDRVSTGGSLPHLSLTIRRRIRLENMQLRVRVRQVLNLNVNHIPSVNLETTMCSLADDHSS